MECQPQQDITILETLINSGNVDMQTLETDDTKNEHKVTTHDVNYIVATMTKRGKSGTVVTPRATTMHILIMDILHRIIANGDYKVEYLNKRDAKKGLEQSMTNSDIEKKQD